MFVFQKTGMIKASRNFRHGSLPFLSSLRTNGDDLMDNSISYRSQLPSFKRKTGSSALSLMARVEYILVSISRILYTVHIAMIGCRLKVEER